MTELQKLGECLMLEVRDASSEEYVRIKEGLFKSSQAQELTQLINSIENNDALDEIVGEIIDRVMHNFLVLFEESQKFTIVDKTKIDNKFDIVHSSDGLSGELYGENGWFSKYSSNVLNIDKE